MPFVPGGIHGRTPRSGSLIQPAALLALRPGYTPSDRHPSVAAVLDVQESARIAPAQRFRLALRLRRTGGDLQAEHLVRDGLVDAGIGEVDRIGYEEMGDQEGLDPCRQERLGVDGPLQEMTGSLSRQGFEVPCPDAMTAPTAEDDLAQVLQLTVPDDRVGVGRPVGVEGVADRDVLLGHRIEGDDGLMVLSAPPSSSRRRCRPGRGCP